MVKCFKCEKEITSATGQGTKRDGTLSDPIQDTWDTPHAAVYFDGGNNFGSRLYDAMVDGIWVELLICDDCLTEGKAKGTMREVDRKNMIQHPFWYD